jgi:hypothetical protein
MLAAGVKERGAQIRAKAAKREQQRQIDQMYHELAEEVHHYFFVPFTLRIIIHSSSSSYVCVCVCVK